MAFNQTTLLLSALAGAVVLQPSMALAQATSIAPPSDEPAARERFNRGVVALGESRFAVAAALFEESYRLNPAPVALFNLAFAYRGLGRYLDAADCVRRYLQNPGNTPADRVEAARAELVTLEQSIARVTLVVRPSSAVVTVDGQPARIANGVIELDPGRRVIELGLDGFRSERRELQLASGARDTLSITLSPVVDTARLRVEPSVPTARVSIDGTFVGTGAIEQRATTGVHRVTIAADGFVTLERTVRVGGTGVVRVDAVLQRPRTNHWLWLGPTIGVVAATGLSIGGYFLWRELRPTADPPLPPDRWGDPVF
ncbi:MAG: PEGA domain-containing protein [Myxococcales bacterium]|nr:PEGA domain-containing protein [Myxococcales bacterium]